MRKYLAITLNSMATGLFASLIIGVILEQLGILFSFPFLIIIGTVAKMLMGPAIGVAVAFGLKAPPLVMVAASIAGALGAGTFLITEGLVQARIGEPVGAFVASVLAIEAGRRIAGKTPIDILALPALTIIVGGIAGQSIAPVMSALMAALGAFINEATLLHPFPMGIIVATAMGMLLTLPISSAAIAISLGLSGLAAGAATVGCASQMIGFAVSSFKDNRWSGLLAQGVGTSMLQIPNIVNNPRIWIPPILTSAILGPVSTILLRMENIPVGAGMGTSGFVGQIGTIAAMGTGAWPSIVLLHFLLPALLTTAFTFLLIRIDWIKPGDMRLKV